MSELIEMQCVACRADAPPATAEEIERWLSDVPDWDLIKVDDIPRLRRAFKFRNFRQALEFTNLVGELAEDEGHHPRITTEWGKVTVTLWTHAIKSLHRNDFILAAKIDRALIEHESDS
ncbi:MAG: 4a-hydroxytetrahydrobiopterin dehydratase [Thermomicrobiales bacterium]